MAAMATSPPTAIPAIAAVEMPDFEPSLGSGESALGSLGASLGAVSDELDEFESEELPSEIRLVS